MQFYKDCCDWNYCLEFLKEDSEEVNLRSLKSLKIRIVFLLEKFRSCLGSVFCFLKCYIQYILEQFKRGESQGRKACYFALFLGLLSESGSKLVFRDLWFIQQNQFQDRIVFIEGDVGCFRTFQVFGGFCVFFCLCRFE